jgi:hypothetical protein
MEEKWPQATTTGLKNVFGREVRKKMNEEKNLSGKNRSGRDRRKLFDVYLLDDQEADRIPEPHLFHDRVPGSDSFAKYAAAFFNT